MSATEDEYGRWLEVDGYRVYVGWYVKQVRSIRQEYETFVAVVGGNRKDSLFITVEGRCRSPQGAVDVAAYNLQSCF